MRHHVRLLALLAAILLPALARAADDAASEKARKLVTDAKADYNLGEYQHAVEKFQEAYRLKQDPAILFNLGQCQRQLHQYDAAARSYRAYLRETKVPADERERLQKRIAEMDKAAADELAKKPPTGTQPAEEPAPKEEHAPPTAPAMPVAVAAPAVSTSPPAPQKSPIYKKWWLWSAVGVVVAGGLGLGLGLGLDHSNSGYKAPGVSF